MKELISLKEHNKTAMQQFYASIETKNVPNSISCPDCGKELVDTDNSIKLASYPPQYYIHCQDKNCNYRGYRTC